MSQLENTNTRVQQPKPDKANNEATLPSPNLHEYRVAPEEPSPDKDLAAGASAVQLHEYRVASADVAAVQLHEYRASSEQPESSKAATSNAQVSMHEYRAV